MLILKEGDYAVDSHGILLKATSDEEIVQRAMILLTMPKGSFGYNKQLGSELSTVDLNNCDDNTLFAIVADALEPIEDLEVNAVNRTLAPEKDMLSITVSVSVKEKQIDFAFIK